MRNTLFYGDNLEILRKHVPDACVDLVYLDPPFNSNRDYNVLFKEQTGEGAQSQIKAFTDTWKWSGEADNEFVHTCPNKTLIDLLKGFVNTLGRNDVTAYLVMMAPRLVELHRVLKPTGSLYLHCDPTASAYLRLVLDCIFGPKNFKSEVIWKRTSAHSSAKRYGPVHDVLLFYTASGSFTWNPQFQPYEPGYVEMFFDQADGQGRRYKRMDLTGAGTRNGATGEIWRGIDVTAKGRHWAYPPPVLEVFDKSGRIHWPTKSDGMPRLKQYVEDLPGVPLQDIWTDIHPMHNLSSERLGYPTQKPQKLLERIILASSNEGDVVLDPFCGCGTAVIAAQQLKRTWMGIDVTSLATTLIKSRLDDTFNLKEKVDYDVVGEPASASDARDLFNRDTHEFQKWAVGLVPRAYPYQDKKGADSGTDGFLYIHDNPHEDDKYCIIQVKGGHVGVAQVRDFRGTMERDKATLGLFVSLEPPTKPMLTEADALGFYKSPLQEKPIQRIQFRTVEQLLTGHGFVFPSQSVQRGVKQAPSAKADAGQGKLEM